MKLRKQNIKQFVLSFLLTVFLAMTIGVVGVPHATSEATTHGSTPRIIIQGSDDTSFVPSKKTLVSDNLFPGGGTDDIGGYLNNLFEIALLIGAVLAVLIIATAGLQYMTTDAVTGKTEGKSRIQQAVLGLLMLMSIYIFFQTVNPDILKLEFQLTTIESGGVTLDTDVQETEETTSTGTIRADETVTVKDDGRRDGGRVGKILATIPGADGTPFHQLKFSDGTTGWFAEDAILR